MKKVLVCGAGGFIGGHLVDGLKKRGDYVCGVDLKEHEFKTLEADDFIIGDLRDPLFCKQITSEICFDELYQLAADMGGAGYIFTGENDASIMHNSATINLNMLEQARKTEIKKIFYSSSACIYPEYAQMEPDNPGLVESDAYPAAPDSEYGWEKLFSERLYLSYSKNFNLEVHIARFHNIFGPYGTWTGGKEKAPAAVCRKVAEATDGGKVNIWGDGQQTRSFLYIEECLQGIDQLMNSTFPGPVNLGSDELITINDLTKIVMDIAIKNLSIKHVEGPQGVRGRCSDNKLINDKLGWKPQMSLREGLELTYPWIAQQVSKDKNNRVT